MVPSSYLLRFSDQELDTVAEHRKVAARGGSVWWAWWKKEFEPWQGAWLAAVARSCPVDIGLVNRQADGGPAFYVAHCEEVQFDASGVRQSTPDVNLTPGYYVDSPYPAWFRFSAIEPLRANDYARRFGSVPKGDATFFRVTERNGRRVTEPDPKLVSEVVAVPGDAILHLSDLHAGMGYGFPVVDREEPTRQDSLSTKIARYVDDLDTQVGALVVSGDLISAGETGDFARAEAILDQILSQLGLERQHVVLVPGNHDMFIDDGAHLTRTYEHEQPFRQFMRGFYGAQIDGIERVVRFRTPSGWLITFGCLNSNRPREVAFKDYGYVGDDKYGPVLDRIRDENKGVAADQLVLRKRLNVAVLHHHLNAPSTVWEPERERPVSLTLDAGPLIVAMQAAGVHLALHGHQHVPSFARTSVGTHLDNKWRPPDLALSIIGMGSCGSRQLWDEANYNSFGVYTPEADGLRVRLAKYTKTTAARTLAEIVLPYC